MAKIEAPHIGLRSSAPPPNVTERFELLAKPTKQDKSPVVHRWPLSNNGAKHYLDKGTSLGEEARKVPAECKDGSLNAAGSIGIAIASAALMLIPAGIAIVYDRRARKRSFEAGPNIPPKRGRPPNPRSAPFGLPPQPRPRVR
jgi:hypothetical protein